MILVQMGRRSCLNAQSEVLHVRSKQVLTQFGQTGARNDELEAWHGDGRHALWPAVRHKRTDGSARA